jgi:hypothetical protein
MGRLSGRVKVGGWTGEAELFATGSQVLWSWLLGASRANRSVILRRVI